MLEGAGTPLLSGSEIEIGPGHCSVIRHNGRWLLAYHYYDPAAAGRPTLAIRHLRWDRQGWPSVATQIIKRPLPPVEPEAPAT